MKVILAEKPSVARDIAVVLGAKDRHDGYYEGQGYQVTWAYGHLVSLKEPEDYDPALKKWTLATLPFVPAHFELKLVTQKGVDKQFSVIKRLFKSADELICATDAGREGELIFRYILSLAGLTKKPFQRLWLSSLTEDAIRKAFQTLQPGSNYDCLYAAARCRSESDWIVGLNATRNMTVRYGASGHLWSVGRVQTPVLAMIVKRDDEIRTFQAEEFWELRTDYRKAIFKHKGGRLKTEIAAKELLAAVQDQAFTIVKIESRQEKEYPPMLYDLTELQREMNRRYAYSASDTLQIAQTLYENKFISYPRTDSRFLSQEIKAEVPAILAKLQAIKPSEIGVLSLGNLTFTSRIVNDKKVGEHHAIIPTGKIPAGLGGLDARSQLVYDAILTRLIAAFYPLCLKQLTTVEGESNKQLFQAKGVQIVEPGWTILYPKEPKEGSKGKEEDQDLPLFIVGESGPHRPLVKQGKTEAPRHYTENSLLGAMETAGKLIEDEHLKEAMKQKGLGTPATRAAMIETLLRRNYLIRDKKTLVATNLGRFLISLIQDSQLKSPELTGEWESKLKDIEKGTLDASEFMKQIVSYTAGIIEQSDASHLDLSCLGPCPQCKRPVIAGKRGYGCSGWKEGCSFVLWKEYKGIVLQEAQIRQLIQRRILLQPLLLADKKVYLALTEKGDLMDIPVPEPVSFKKAYKKPVASSYRKKTSPSP